MRTTVYRLPFLALSVWILGSIGQAANLPPDFEETVLYTSEEVPLPAAIEWGPDGNLWIATNRAGNIYVRENDTLKLLLNLYPVPFPGRSEQGLHNFILDPDYLTNQHVWIFYNFFPAVGPTTNRLSRFTRVGDVLQDELVLLDIPLAGNKHNGGCLAFAEDKTLYVGLGEDGLGSTTAQDLFDLRGKILRLERDGSHAPDNPFADGTLADPRVWAYGLRNPYRCTIRPDGTDTLYISDVGGCCWEELNIGLAGANYGYAYAENPYPQGVPEVTYPIFAYPHSPIGGAIVGADHVGPGELAPQFEGDYFFADFSAGQIWRTQLQQGRWRGPLWAATPPVYIENSGLTELWADGIDGLLDLEFGPDGALYYAAWKGPPDVNPTIGRIAYEPGANRQPEAVATGSPTNGGVPLLVTLDGTASSDPDGDTLSYSWDLGDGQMASGPTVQHSYGLGIFEAVLTVDDGIHPPVSAPPVRIVPLNTAPTATLLTPTPATTFDAGQTIGFSGSATDPDQNIVCNYHGWQVLLHEPQASRVVHGPRRGGCSGSFTTLDVGNPSPDVSYEIILTVNDTGAPIGLSGILAGDASVEIFPNTSNITLQTTPLADLALELDSQPVTAPLTVEGVVQFRRTIGAVDAQLHPNGHTYRWLSWSDGGALEHEIQTPAADSTYTADFGCNVLAEAGQLQVGKGGAGQLSFAWSPISDICLAAAPERYELYAASTAVPASPPGSFPDDPPWSLVGSSATEAFSYTPGPDDRYFLVVGRGTDGLPGAAGHYAE